MWVPGSVSRLLKQFQIWAGRMPESILHAYLRTGGNALAFTWLFTENLDAYTARSPQARPLPPFLPPVQVLSFRA